MNIRSISKAVGTLALAMAATASQAVTITNNDGSYQNFKGIDWLSNGVAFTNDFDSNPQTNPGSSFTLYYFAQAGSLYNTSDITFLMPHLDNTSDGISNSIGGTINPATNNLNYEYTIVAKVTEKVISCNGATFECTFQVTGGQYSVFYDMTPDANRAPGGAATGYADGTLLLQGDIFFSSKTNTFSNVDGGQVSISGDVDYTNPLYIQPNLGSTIFVSTLQLAPISTGAAPPNTADLGLYGGVTALTGVRLQADANQTFEPAQVPEPSGLALAGVALLGLMGLRRRQA